MSAPIVEGFDRIKDIRKTDLTKIKKYTPLTDLCSALEIKIDESKDLRSLLAGITVKLSSCVSKGCNGGFDMECDCFWGLDVSGKPIFVCERCQDYAILRLDSWVSIIEYHPGHLEWWIAESFRQKGGG
jgi:hypothetical protein